MDIEVLVGGICMYKEIAYTIRPEKTNDFLKNYIPHQRVKMIGRTLKMNRK